MVSSFVGELNGIGESGLTVESTKRIRRLLFLLSLSPETPPTYDWSLFENGLLSLPGEVIHMFP